MTKNSLPDGAQQKVYRPKALAKINMDIRNIAITPVVHLLARKGYVLASQERDYGAGRQI